MEGDRCGSLSFFLERAQPQTKVDKDLAGDESRTRDLNVGNVALYQLSYSRAPGTL